MPGRWVLRLRNTMVAVGLSIPVVFLSSPSVASAQPLEGVPVIVNMTSSANPSPFEQDVTYGVTLVTNDGGSPADADYIEFQDNRNDIFGCGVAPLVPTTTPGTFTASCDEPGSSMSVGDHSIAALFAGDSTYAFGSASLTQVVNLGTTTTAITSPSPGSSVTYGSESNESYGVSVTAAAGVSLSPSGSVNLYAGAPGPSTFLCDAFLGGSGPGQASGQCYINDTTLTADAYSLTAVYGGDSSFEGSTSVAIDFTVNQVNTQMSVFTVLGYAFYGAENGNFLIVGVGGGNNANPTGYLTITADGTNLVGPSTCSASNGGGQPCYFASATALPASTSPYTVTTSYAGDANFAPASATSLLSVYPATTTTTLNVSPTSVLLGQEASVVISATVSTGTTGAPSGTIVVRDAGKWVCTISNLTALGSNAAAGTCPALTANQLAAGSQGLTADYLGDGNYSSSVSAARSLTVTTTPKVLIVSNVITFNKNTRQAPVKLTCTDAPCSGSLTLTETVTVKQGVGRRMVTHKKTIDLASSSYSLKEGKSRLVYIPLTSAQHSQLARSSVRTLLREKLVATVKGGNRTTKLVVVT
jgi:hypothetical protein